MNNKPLFGVAGFPVNFFASEIGKKRENIFLWLSNIGLNVIELQCTYGIRMKEEQAIHYKQLASKYNIVMTIHAPYYISLSSLNPEVVKRSKEEMKKAFSLAKLLGVKRIIFHPGGGYGKTTEQRTTGLAQLIDALNSIKDEVDTENIKLYPEIGGKTAQLGSLNEIIEICKKVDYAYPCIDLAHLHARELGSMNSTEKIVEVLKKIEEELGREYLEQTHFHVYPVDYGDKGEKVHKAFGEKKDNQISLTDDEQEYLPRAKDYIEAIKKLNINPITICEAHNTQDVGAQLMRDIYLEK